MGEVEFSKTNLDDRLKFSPKALIETKKRIVRSQQRSRQSVFSCQCKWLPSHAAARCRRTVWHHLTGMFPTEFQIDIGKFTTTEDIVVIHVIHIYSIAITVAEVKRLLHDCHSFIHRSVFDKKAFLCHISILLLLFLPVFVLLFPESAIRACSDFNSLEYNPYSSRSPQNRSSELDWILGDFQISNTPILLTDITSQSFSSPVAKCFRQQYRHSRLTE